MTQDINTIPVDVIPTPPENEGYFSDIDIDIDYDDIDDDEQSSAQRYPELSFRVRTIFPTREERLQSKDLASFADITLNNAFVLKHIALMAKQTKDVNGNQSITWKLSPPKQNGSRYENFLFDYEIEKLLIGLATDAQDKMVKRYDAQLLSYVGDEQPEAQSGDDDKHMTVYYPEYDAFKNSDPLILQTSIRMDNRMDNSTSKIAAYADVTFNGVITVRGFRIVHRDKSEFGADGKSQTSGYWLAMPSIRTANAKGEDICYPITSDFRSQLESEVIGAFSQELENFLDHYEWLKSITETK